MIGVISTYVWNRMMINVSLGTLNKTRENLFKHMESLPIGYFDTHAHGDIMSIYTNDTDTLRQCISQSIPQVINSGAQIIFVITAMLIMSWQLALITIVFGIIMFFLSRYLGGHSAKYFRAQQKNLGKVNGFIEEMMEGSRVIKVFTHEEAAIADFEKSQ